MTPDRVQMIVLAAGLSQRHPGKLLTSLDGQTAIAKTLWSLLDAGLHPIVVLGADDEELRQEVRRFTGSGVRVVTNSHPEAGMASSIRIGVEAILNDADAIGIHLADKPFCHSETVSLLLAEWERLQPLALVPRWRGQHGHPVLFYEALRSELMQLEGDSGGKALLRDLGQKAVTVDVEDEGVVLDMDRYLEEHHGRE